MAPQHEQADVHAYDDEGTSLLAAVNPISPSNDNIQHYDDQPTKRNCFATELREQLKTAVPALQSLVLSKIPWFITLRFLGSFGEQGLASGALATTLNNVTGLSFCVGFSFALSTLSGQAKGAMISNGQHMKMKRTTTRAKDLEREETGLTTEAASLSLGSSSSSSDEYPIPSTGQQQENEAFIPNTTIVFLIRGMILQLCLVVPVGLSWIFGIEGMLLKLGQTPTTAIMASRYLRVLAPSLWSYSIQWTFTAWLQSIGMADVPARAALLGLMLHVPFNFLFLYGMKLGYLGCAWAVVAFQTVQMTYIIVYLFLTTTGRSRVLECTGGIAVGRTSLTFWPEFRIAFFSFQGYLQYLGLALPGLVIISEWWASETAIFLAGRLHPDSDSSLGGMTLYQSINSFCFMFPMAFAIAASTRVGNLLGAGQSEAAAWAGKVSVAAATTLSIIIGIFLFLLPHDLLPRLFVPHEEAVVDKASSTIPLLSLYVIADGIQVALNGIIKGCGRQCVTVPIVVLAYWVLGVPLAYYMAFVKNGGESDCDSDSDEQFCGDVGLVAGMTTGTWAHMLMLAIVVACTTNWTREATRARERVAADHK
mmetsp:Transcript_21667/g.51177  ORF Transcript_21667/g.51177 Transcript_21667/m.51177 type:complete len:593 (-) Transcript_21667:24-1802(-)